MYVNFLISTYNTQGVILILYIFFKFDTILIFFSATVLDFNQDEREKTGLDGQAGGWLSTFFGQPSSNQRPNHRLVSRKKIVNYFFRSIFDFTKFFL